MLYIITYVILFVNYFEQKCHLNVCPLLFFTSIESVPVYAYTLGICFPGSIFIQPDYTAGINLLPVPALPDYYWICSQCHHGPNKSMSPGAPQASMVFTELGMAFSLFEIVRLPARFLY